MFFSDGCIVKLMSFFDRQKESALAGVDLSRKGSIDLPIVKLTEVINSHSDTFTLSSCSGRVVLLREAPIGQSVRKAGCDWLRVSHEELRPDSVMDSLDTREAGTPGTVVLKFEPFVLHVQCRDVDTARRMCACAVEAGFRNSGITWGRAGKLVMAVRSTHGLEVPITDDAGAELVTREYVAFIVEKANSKLRENFKRIKKFEDLTIEILNKKLHIEEKENKKTRKIYRRKNKRNKDQSSTFEKGEEEPKDIFNDFEKIFLE